MDEYIQAISYLPQSLRTAAEQLSPLFRERVHEIRLRQDAPLTLSCSDGEWWLTARGERTTVQQAGVVLCRLKEVEECVLRLCNYSVHTHQEELRQGFVCTDSGCRAGLGGTLVVQQNTTVTMRNITSVCLRVARLHKGCAAPLMPWLTDHNRPSSALLCGPPSSGKTTLLRDAARGLALGTTGRKWRVSVVDERGELSPGNGLQECDVLVGGKKADGILQAIRCLAPDVVVFDEWGGEEECRAVRECVQCGVAVLTSCHAGSLRELWRRPSVSRVLREGGIPRLILLGDHGHAGTITRCVEVGDWIVENHRIDLRDRSRYRHGISERENAQEASAETRMLPSVAELYGKSGELYGGSHSGDIA